MSDQVTQIKDAAFAALSAAKNLDEVEALRVQYLGKKGQLTAQMKTLGGMSDEERRTVGVALNQLKDELVAAIEAKKEEFERVEMNARLAEEKVDVTLPVRPQSVGRIHPISQVTEEMTAIFADMGFKVAEGPSIEDDWHNFGALNFPPDHPARQMHDTFYLPPLKEGEENQVLRTHTSSVQIRVMEEQKPPIRIIIPGRTYRSDYDLTHTPMFHQMEGLWIDEKVNFAHLKGCIIEFCERFFEMEDLPIQFRPSFFPFTEPSAEVDIGCSRKGGGLAIGAGDDWLEVLGCGMVHPNVLKNCGIDPEKYQGFAFGMGIERFAMLKYGIPDLRTFFEADQRWLKHYGFLAGDAPSAAQGLTSEMNRKGTAK